MAKKDEEDEAKYLEQIRMLDSEGFIESDKIANILGYETFENYEEVAVYTKGYRILSKIPRVPANIVSNMVRTFKSFQHILIASIEQLDEVEGIGEVRARTIQQSLKRMQEQLIFDNVLIR
jgi:diadenylate cyclase